VEQLDLLILGLYVFVIGRRNLLSLITDKGRKEGWRDLWHA